MGMNTLLVAPAMSVTVVSNILTRVSPLAGGHAPFTWNPQATLYAAGDDVAYGEDGELSHPFSRYQTQYARFVSILELADSTIRIVRTSNSTRYGIAAHRISAMPRTPQRPSHRSVATMKPRIGADGADGTVATRPKRQQAMSWSARGSPRGYRPRPFRTAQLQRLKLQHAEHCQKLPVGRPLVLIVEPKWWKKRRQQRSRTKGTKSDAKGRDQRTTAERLFGSIRSQLSVVRREDTLLQTYAARIARCVTQWRAHCRA